jgi:hypothetical protein
VIWLLRHLKPDFNTIADFRSRNCHASAMLCRKLDLFDRELVAVDGTRIKAVNNKDRNFTRASLAKFIERLTLRSMITFGAARRPDMLSLRLPIPPLQPDP